MENSAKKYKGLTILIFILAVGFFVFGNVATASAVNCNWTAASSTNISDINNWSGSGCALAATDNLIFN